MAYRKPELFRVGSASNVVLGGNPVTDGDNLQGIPSTFPDLVAGLDD